MKKTLKYLPLMLYPYAFLVALITAVAVGKSLLPQNPAEMSYTPFVAALVSVSAFGLAYSIFAVVQAAKLSIFAYKGKYTLAEASKIIMIIKLVQIPAYICYFILGMIGFFMSVWGIGVILAVVAVDFISITMTGLASLGTVLRMKDEQKKPMYLLVGLGMFIFCVDVVLAVYCYSKVKKQTIN